MSDATQAEKAAEGLSAERRDDFHEFQVLYRNWLAARAACNDPDVPDDEAMNARPEMRRCRTGALGNAGVKCLVCFCKVGSLRTSRRL